MKVVALNYTAEGRHTITFIARHVAQVRHSVMLQNMVRKALSRRIISFTSVLQLSLLQMSRTTCDTYRTNRKDPQQG